MQFEQQKWREQHSHELEMKRLELYTNTIRHIVVFVIWSWRRPRSCCHPVFERMTMTLQDKVLLLPLIVALPPKVVLLRMFLALIWLKYAIMNT